MKIDINILKIICNNILSDMIDAGIKEIEFDRDYYWNIDSDSIYDFSRIPTSNDITAGSLSDDMEDLISICIDDNVTAPFLLGKISTLFRAIADDDYCESTCSLDLPEN